MNETRDWQGMKQMSARLLQERTGANVEAWKKRMEQKTFNDEQQLRAWLSAQGVTGYPQSLLVMERFGYPDFMLASADELIEGQYADRSQLRPILDAILAASVGLGPFTIQARKTCVSLVSPRRTFARVQPTTKQRVDLGLRLEGLLIGHIRLRGRNRQVFAIGNSSHQKAVCPSRSFLIPSKTICQFCEEC